MKRCRPKPKVFRSTSSFFLFQRNATPNFASFDAPTVTTNCAGLGLAEAERPELANRRELCVWPAQEERARIVWCLQCLLEQKQWLHHTRLAGAVGSGEQREGPDFDRLLIDDRLETGDGKRRDGVRPAHASFSELPFDLVIRRHPLPDDSPSCSIDYRKNRRGPEVFCLSTHGHRPTLGS